MSLEEYRGVAWAFSELMKRASTDATRGGTKAGRTSLQPGTAGPTHVGLLAAKVLRRAVGWRVRNQKP